MGDINYKTKYQELKLKFMNSVDVSFRLGYEQGMKDGQNSALQQQQQAALEAQNQGAIPGKEGTPSEVGDQVEQQEEAPISENPSGSELDQHIAELESLIGKSEDAALKKSLESLKNFRKTELQAIELKKSEKAIKAIAKSLKVPHSGTLPKQASHNLPDNAKKSLSMQEKIVENIMEQWKSEEINASNDILQTLKVENLIKQND